MRLGDGVKIRLTMLYGGRNRNIVSEHWASVVTVQFIGEVTYLQFIGDYRCSALSASLASDEAQFLICLMLIFLLGSLTGEPKVTKNTFG